MDALTSILFQGGRSSKQKLPSFVSGVVDIPARGIPDLGDPLPLVYKMRGAAHECKLGIDLGSVAFGRVVELGHARRPRERCPCLAAPFGPDDFNAAERTHESVETAFDEPGPYPSGVSVAELVIVVSAS